MIPEAPSPKVKSLRATDISLPMIGASTTSEKKAHSGHIVAHFTLKCWRLYTLTSAVQGFSGFDLTNMTDPSRALPLTRSSVLSAQKLIEPYIHRTPVLTSSTLNTIVSTPQTPESLIGTPWEAQTPAEPKMNLFFKCENFQKIGAFKIRGASHALSRLSRDELDRGVVTHSSGRPRSP